MRRRSNAVIPDLEKKFCTHPWEGYESKAQVCKNHLRSFGIGNSFCELS